MGATVACRLCSCAGRRVASLAFRARRLRSNSLHDLQVARCYQGMPQDRICLDVRLSKIAYGWRERCTIMCITSICRHKLHSVSSKSSAHASPSASEVQLPVFHTSLRHNHLHGENSDSSSTLIRSWASIWVPIVSADESSNVCCWKSDLCSSSIDYCDGFHLIVSGS